MDQTEVYVRYAEQERALRIQAVSALRKREEKMFGKLTDIKEVKDDHSSEDEGPTPKRPRVNMMSEHLQKKMLINDSMISLRKEMQSRCNST